MLIHDIEGPLGIAVPRLSPTFINVLLPLFPDNCSSVLLCSAGEFMTSLKGEKLGASIPAC